MRGERLRARKTRAGGSSQATKASPSPRPTSHPVLQLQADIGNRAINRLIKHQGKRSQSFSQRPLQAKGGFRGLSSEIMEKSQPREVLRSHASGKSMPEGVQEKMETAFGTSFSDVRIHEGPEASSLGAIAYTRGTHIHFQPGQYNPTSQTGQKLLGHELTHVVQQRAKRVPVPQAARGVFVNRDSALEAEADRLGAKAARGESARQGINTVAASPSQMSSPIQLIGREDLFSGASTAAANTANILGAADASGGASGGVGLAGNVADLASVFLEGKEALDLGRKGEKGKAAAGVAKTALHSAEVGTDLAKNIATAAGSSAATALGGVAAGFTAVRGTVETVQGVRSIHKAEKSKKATKEIARKVATDPSSPSQSQVASKLTSEDLTERQNKLAKQIVDKTKDIKAKEDEAKQQEDKIKQQSKEVKKLTKKENKLEKKLDPRIEKKARKIEKKEEALGTNKDEIKAKRQERNMFLDDEQWVALLFARAELTHLKAERENLKEELNSLSDKKAELERRKETAASSTDAAKDELKELQKQYEDQVNKLKSLKGEKTDIKRRNDILEVALETAIILKKQRNRAIVNTAASAGETLGASLTVAGAFTGGAPAVAGVVVTAGSASVKPVAFAARKFKQKARDKGVRGFDQTKTTTNKQQQRSHIANLLLNNYTDTDMQEIFEMLPVTKEELKYYKSKKITAEYIEEILKRRG